MGSSVVTSIATDVWPVWNVVYVSSGSCTVSNYVGTDAWPAWNHSYVVPMGSSSWSSSAVITDSNMTWTYWIRGHQESEEQRIAREQEEVRHQVRLAKELAERARVQSVAQKLLLDNLTREQRARFEKERVLEVIGGSHKHRYLIDAGGGVKRIDDKGPVESYCIHPRYDRDEHMIPVQDLILAKKLMLEHNEEEFLKTANATRLRRVS
jgi:hypothetical protein